MTAPHPALTHAALCDVVSLSPVLRRHVRGCFPRLCESLVEDAVSAVMLSAVERPQGFLAAREESPARLLGLCKVIAWRHARGIVRRRGYRAERYAELLDGFARELPGQEAWVELLELDKHIHAACCAVSTRDCAQLEAALKYRLMTGETDTRTAELFCIRREYINRARRKLYDAKTA